MRVGEKNRTNTREFVVYTLRGVMEICRLSTHLDGFATRLLFSPLLSISICVVKYDGIIVRIPWNKASFPRLQGKKESRKCPLKHDSGIRSWFATFGEHRGQSAISRTLTLSHGWHSGHPSIGSHTAIPSAPTNHVLTHYPNWIMRSEITCRCVLPLFQLVPKRYGLRSHVLIRSQGDFKLKPPLEFRRWCHGNLPPPTSQCQCLF